PLVEYRNEGHLMFQDLNRAIREEVIALLFHAQVEAAPPDARPGGDGGGPLPRSGPNGGGPDGNPTYEHQSLAGAEAIAAAARGVATPVGGGGGGSVATRPVVKSE